MLPISVRTLRSKSQRDDQQVNKDQDKQRLFHMHRFIRKNVSVVIVQFLCQTRF